MAAALRRHRLPARRFVPCFIPIAVPDLRFGAALAIGVAVATCGGVAQAASARPGGFTYPATLATIRQVQPTTTTYRARQTSFDARGAAKPKFTYFEFTGSRTRTRST